MQGCSIHTGDALAWLQSQAEGSFALLILDPPYNVGYRYKGSEGFKDVKPPHVYLAEQVLALAHCQRLLRPGGSVFYLNYPEFTAELWGRVDFLDRFKILPWVYHPQTGGYPLRKGSRAWGWFTKGEPKFNPQAFDGEYRNPTDPRIRERMERGEKPKGLDWLDFEQVKNTSREKREHPCQVPQAMIEKLILGTTDPGDLVGDPYLGSGTTALAALKLGRLFSGCEISPAYVAIAEKALSQAQALALPDLA